MYYRNYTDILLHCVAVIIYTGSISCVLCREVYYTVSIFGRTHCQRFHCSEGKLHHSRNSGQQHRVATKWIKSTEFSEEGIISIHRLHLLFFCS